jgi:flagellar biosynthetic protein FliO
MRSYKRKIAVFLGAILLCSGVTFAYSAQSGADNDVESLVSKSAPLNDNQPKLTVGSNSNIETGGLFLRMMLMVLMVVCLGMAAVYLSKRLIPRLNLPGKRIQVSETVHLGPRKAIHLIKIGKQMFLIGSTNENITKLADITDQLSETDLS